MKASDKFKTAIESYLSEKAQNDALFSADYKKESKNLESCFHYIFGEVKKTGECAFDNQEIFDMAVNGIATKKWRLFTLLIFHFAVVIIPFRLVFCIQ